MKVPCDIIIKFGSALPAAIKPDAVITTELEGRIQRLLTGQFTTDEQDRCVIDIEKVWDPTVETRDSVCVGVDLGPVSISYCKDVK